MPSINRIYDAQKSLGLEVLLVNMREDERHVQATVKARGYRAPVVLDSRGEVSGLYGVTATPTVFLVDRKGLIIGRAIGMRDWESPPARAVLDALLAERRESRNR